MNYIKFYIYNLFLSLYSNNKEDINYYNKIINNTTNFNGVRVNHDLIARINARKLEEPEHIIVDNISISIFKIQRLREEKERLINNRKKVELKEFNEIMKILNINI